MIVQVKALTRDLLNCIDLDNINALVFNYC